MNLYIDRVESGSNPADGPSRWDFNLLESLGFEWQDPALSFFLNNSSMDPSRWFSQMGKGSDEPFGADRMSKGSQSTHTVRHPSPMT
eukprot:3666024-Amphidinium_carterae.1